MELNKLTLSADKCSKIHIGKKCEQCPKLKVHETNMKESQKEKYLGDSINNKGTLKDTIESRIAKGWAYVSEIGAILSEFPFGSKKKQVGLMLCEAHHLETLHYRLKPIKEAQFGFAHFVSHFIRVQIFQIDFPLILSASKYFR